MAWLDLLSAKVRFGGALGGVLPEPTPWPDIFRQRSGAALAAAAAASEGAGGARRSAERATLRLCGLRHPLLLLEHLVTRASLQQQLRAAGGSAGAGTVAGGARGPARRAAPQERQQRRAAAAAAAAASSSGSSGGSSDGVPSLAQQLESCQPPIPVDLVVQPETSVVVITGAPHACWCENDASCASDSRRRRCRRMHASMLLLAPRRSPPRS